MRNHSIRLSAMGILAVICTVVGLGSPGTTKTLANPASWQIFATGLNNPRGLTFGADGSLYVAEGGTGGTKITTSQDCQQVPAPSGPYRGGMTARISKISPDGKRTTVIDGLPSTATAPRSGSDVSGVAAVAFLDDTLYALMAGAGCSHGNKGTLNGLIRISADGKAIPVADLSSFLQANPVVNPDPADFEPDGDPYSLIQVDGRFYVMEANHGELDKITTDGRITGIVDISASQRHIVPTALAYHDGNFYVGTLTVFPVFSGIARILKITPEGDITVLAPHLSAVLGVAFDAQGQMYALETSTVDQKFPVAGSGMVVRVQSDSGDTEVIATGLSYPTALTFGPDGMLYISNFGYGAGPGRGQIVRMTFPAPQS